ncbi:MAG: hypothetical protein NTZ74_04660 [Chloroflexi bacterium]|nr:hypothetical protein [Chloroflexota bacterium]
MAKNKPAKKVILFLVEGITDQTTLGLILSKIINTQSIHFTITYGDICYKEGVDSTNAIIRTYDYVKSFMEQTRFQKSNFLRIVHLIDTDGAFIPDNNVY